MLHGGTAIVIASPSHRAVLVAAMESAGVDLSAARAGHHLLELDAADTLERLFVSGDPGPDVFEAVIGGDLRRAAGGGGEVRAYGEMVGLLWDEGRVGSLLALEGLWNDLATRLPFSLVCGYPESALATPGTVLDHIRRMHRGRPTHLDGLLAGAVGVRSRRFPCGPEAPAAARRFVAGLLAEWNLDPLTDDALTVVSELATNAVIHARSDVTVAVGELPDGVRIVVGDDSTLAPMVRSPDLATFSGRGIHVVAAVSSDWGAELLPDGKAVWAELRAAT